MPAEVTNAEMRDTLVSLNDADFKSGVRRLLETLGYRSERTLESSGDVGEFIERLPAPNPNTKSEREFRKCADSVHIVFQVTDDEIGPRLQRQNPSADDTFHGGLNESFIFTAVELRGKSYPRGQYAGFTREINKRLPGPAVVLFRTATGRVTLAFVHRRQHRTEPRRDVLGSVSMVREIDPAEPHRAHLDILAELSLPRRLKWMSDRDRPHNFDGLLAAWLDALDTEELNRRFYRELSEWYERAIGAATFPGSQNIPAAEHVIRLITRLLFIWFVKQKGLVAEDLFVEEQVKKLLKNYDRKQGDSYYRAVLQNLFFATLNTEIGKRGFSKRSNATHRDFSRYRYRDEMAAPDRLLDLFARTPFINGGLFDCLDSEEANGDGGYRIDCFSDNPRHSGLLSIPDRLFFDDDRDSPGLIELLAQYKFTVEENTPVEREVALDPELLGKVFENLLAAYNPETKETARKQTGSYYTPRPVVDYMVDEALVASLAERVTPDDGDKAWLSERLRYLLDYEDDGGELFFDAERKAIVRAIAEIRILDPAVGSGAFPMGALHKLTLALRRLDSDNELWEALQKEQAGERATDAFDTKNQAERDAELTEISDTFERYRDSDFGRKLYLIQNSIYGADIQPIACQIAKLRFFISLAIEQEPTGDVKENYGIKPLPNLETRFVAANTLIGLRLSDAASLFQDNVRQLQNEIDDIRNKYFLANNRPKKLKLSKQEENCRQKLEQTLEENHGEWAEMQRRAIEQKIEKLPRPEQREQMRKEWDKKYRKEKRRFDESLEDAQKIARWDPYDQNAKADWFDAEYMFGVDDGFDVVIGNPPYVRADSGDRHLELRQRIEASKQYETLWEKWDLYIPFIERGFKLLKEGGFTTMIVSDAYCHSKYAQKSQNYFLKNSRIMRLDFLGKIQIFDAAVRNVTYLFQRADGSHNRPERRMHEPEFGSVNLLPTQEQRELTHRVFFPEDADFQPFSIPTVKLSEICYISVGMVVHADEKKVQGAFDLRDLTSSVKDALHPKPFVEGKHLDRWLPATNNWLEWGTERAPGLFRRPTFPELYEVKEKLISVDMAANAARLRVSYDNQQLLHNHSAWSFVLWSDLSGVRNRSIKKQTRYHNEKPYRPDLPKREDLEQTSSRFKLKFLLGVMNSTVARDFLRANRRSNIHLYPDDWKELPIPDASLDRQNSIISLVDKILNARAADQSADISEWEDGIDWLVYALYDITNREIKAVEK